jgi:diguanylate cyclase (GGDEF)-like protein/PAS domain S-box-containing protein
MSNVVFVELTSAGECTYVSENAQRVFGYDPATLIGLRLSEFVHPDDRELSMAIHDVALPDETTVVSLRLRDARNQWVHSALRGRRHGNSILVAAEVRYADPLRDPLTGLGNREFFESRLRARASTPRHDPYGVILLDVDRFRHINESFSSGVGDGILRELSRRFERAVKARDVVCRVADDTFAVLVDPVGHSEGLNAAALRLRDLAGLPTLVRDQAIVVTASVGAALSTGTATAAELMRDAGIALNSAKALGGARYVLFDESLHHRSRARLSLANDLHGAVARGEVRIALQPIVSLDGGRILACEALARWLHPVHGAIPAEEFIALAEQYGALNDVMTHVFRQACRMRSRDARAGAAYRLNVNLSVGELFVPRIAEVLRTIARAEGVAPGDITLEITEHSALEGTPLALSALDSLRAAGFRICIDDFGVGYSSLRYLAQFSVDALKIDRSFISGNGRSLASVPIARSIIVLARELDIEVVAEGVETAQQRDELLELGCTLGQGYYLAPPVIGDDLAPSTILTGAERRMDVHSA